MSRPFVRVVGPVGSLPRHCRRRGGYRENVITVGSTLVDRYRVERLIARGGMASVFAAHDDVLDRPVAVEGPERGKPSTGTGSSP